MSALLQPQKGTWVLLSFIGFFAVIFSVNMVFVTTALNTHSGVVTEKPYEKGLAYDDLLETARTQPDITQSASFEDGRLKWYLSDEDGKPLQASVTARLFRPVKGGYDFDITLTPQGPGLYSADLDLPLKGHWIAQLRAEWKTQQYQTRLSFTAQ